MNINEVVISGNLTRNAELLQTQGGTTILRFGMAVNERRKDRNGEWQDYANFIDCVRFGDSGDYWAQRLTKGLHVMVKGRLRYSSWEKDGERRSKLEVIAENIDAPAQKGTTQQGQPQSAPQQQPPAFSAPAPMPPQQGVYDEDIPF